MTGGALFVLFAVVAVGLSLALYALVRAEHEDRDRMSRTDAERAARNDEK